MNKNKKTICFYTYELFPFTDGGCGTYLRSKVDKMLKENYNVIIIFYGSEDIIDKIEKYYIENQNFKIFSTKKIANNKKYINIYKQRSFEFYLALKEICKYQKIDIVEMFEYVGIGYFTLKNKKALPPRIEYVVRAHGSMKIIDFYEKQFRFNFFRHEMYKMEKFCLIKSDIRFFPSKNIVEDYNKFYRFNFLNLKNQYIPLPLNYIKKYKPINKNDNALNFLYFSNLKKIKSPETFIRAGILFYEENPTYKGEFIVAGSNTPYNNKITYQQYLENIVPKNLKDKFIFLGSLKHDQLKEVLKNVNTAVITSKWESFSLVFYELKKLKTNIIVRDINCFKSFKNIRKFSTIEELSTLLKKTKYQ